MSHFSHTATIKALFWKKKMIRSQILSTYYGNFINVRWFLIVQLIENSVFSSPKIFKTELVLRFLQITDKPIQKMIQEKVNERVNQLEAPTWSFVHVSRNETEWEA